MAKNEVQGGREPGRVKVNFLLCAPDTKTGPGLEAAYSILTFLERGSSGYFQSPLFSSGSKEHFHGA